eukprot:scaffold246801_cov27-Tisochrysis_lutea.AAC.1
MLLHLVLSIADALELLACRFQALGRLGLDPKIKLALAGRRVAAGRIVGALGDDCRLGPLLDGEDRVTMCHFPPRSLRVVVDLELGHVPLRHLGLG